MNTTEKLIIRRYPKSENRSLRPYSAADELILEYIKNESIVVGNTLILNDLFGYLACNLNKNSPLSIVNYKSQEKALRQNLLFNELPIKEKNIITPLDEISVPIDTALIKAPKSLDLFRLQLLKINQSITDDGIVICGFMTRHFSKQMIEIAGEFFEEIEQSKAQKKARLLILKKKKTVSTIDVINEVKLDTKTSLKQYFGVFSANNIDFATLFFLEHLKISKTDHCILDLASGNGILAIAARKQNPKAEIHLVDDSFLAVESSKLNINDENTHFHFSDCLENFNAKFFDLAISNPPYHFEHETNIEVALELFKNVKKCLKPAGHFQMVSSNHLNFKTHLTKLFSSVNIVAENDKFVIYDCHN